MNADPTGQTEWRDERLRYQVLRYIYDRLGPDCVAILTGPEISCALALTEEDDLLVVSWHTDRRYVRHFGARPRRFSVRRAPAISTTPTCAGCRRADPRESPQ